MSVTLRCVAADHCTADPVTKKFPASTKVSLFKRLATKLFKMPPDQMILYRKDDDGALTYLDDDSMPISYFGLEDGAVVDVADKVDD